MNGLNNRTQYQTSTSPREPKGLRLREIER